jgi:GDPmannose 4,6-dehydratase
VAFSLVGKTVRWEGSGLDEKGYDATTNEVLVCINPYYFRPSEVESLIGDCTKAETALGWSRRIGFLELVKEMVESDCAA